MSDTTPRLALPFLVAAQAQKHVTHNEALIKLDALGDLYLTSMALTAPPASPADGDAYLVASGGTGAWSGYDGKIAYCLDGAWRFYAPFKGLRAYNAADNRIYIYSGSAWSEWNPGNTSAQDVFEKADYDSVVFTKTAAGTISIKAGTRVGLGGTIYSFSSAAAVTMPTLTAGTDYAIYICSDGTLQASTNFSYPSGYSASTSRKIGGFHYAPGGNAAAHAGGDSTPAINAYSIWDLKWRPACNDPRGMTLVANRFWCDIYLTNTNVDVNGSSAYGLMIADGSSPPKIPVTFGGNGSTAYSTLMQFEAAEVLAAVGKELLNYEEFSAAAYGTTEGTNVAGSADPVNTGLDAVHTSKWGVMQSTGNMWVWGRDFSYRADGADVATLEAWGWKNNTGGRGQIYAQGTYGLVSAVFGGNWNNGSLCGSRSSSWSTYPWDSYNYLGARGRCDHLRLV